MLSSINGPGGLGLEAGVKINFLRKTKSTLGFFLAAMGAGLCLGGGGWI